MVAPPWEPVNEKNVSISAIRKAGGFVAGKRSDAPVIKGLAETEKITSQFAVFREGRWAWMHR